jgi:hypothetical protein
MTKIESPVVSIPGVMAFDTPADVLRMGCVASSLGLSIAHETWNRNLRFTHLDQVQDRFLVDWGRLCREVFAAGLGVALETQRVGYAVCWLHRGPWYGLNGWLTPGPSPTAIDPGNSDTDSPD